ncbi:7857_t:CDS:10 [Gigaspora margarita]|uniref:Molybdenum cofactor sulfurase n=1 Tax=Gigaspora margarita TaxID=4874 RepID=A0ABM8W4V5_GIGMA|nr:7857_t:CDS:10 [Gigaspora margarita]
MVPSTLEDPFHKIILKYSSERLEFLKEFSSQYGYNGRIDSIRENEYPQLKDSVYLDHSGATVYAKSVVSSFANDLTNNLFGNPHSYNPSSQLTSQRVELIRARILKHFNANPGEYQVIFTQNASAAIKLVGEAFPWINGQSSFKYLRESHNSVIGLRRFAEENNSPVIQALTEEDLESSFKNIHEYPIKDNLYPEINHETVYNLFAYPAQCNFSGQRFPIKWTQMIKRLDSDKSKTLVLLDAAAYVATSPLSLADKETSPDFVAISFYKIFGFPTGLGALLVKTELTPILKKRYFGGGTIRAVAYDRLWQEFRENLSDRYEDGTINFLEIISLEHAFNSMERIYMNFCNIKNHVTSLSSYLYKRMNSLRHWNGSPVCVIHANNDFSDSSIQGPVFNFNVKRADGSWVGYLEVEKLASVHGIHVRTGGFCNPGCLSRWVNVNSDQVMANYKTGKVCGDDHDIHNGKPTGSIRISLGAMSTIDDVLIWLDFFNTYFVESIPPCKILQNGGIDTNITYSNQSNFVVERVTLFPIKSCHGFIIPPSSSWPVTSQGLLYDREWMLVNLRTGKALSQKIYPRMTLIHPVVFRDKELLVISAPGQDPLQINLNEYPDDIDSSTTCSSQVCGDKIETFIYTSPHITNWFTNFLGIPCRLARQPPITNDENNFIQSRRFIKSHLDVPLTNSHLSLSNESPFLLISRNSVNHVNEMILESENKDESIVADCFRANILIKTTCEYEEDEWKMIRIGEQVFKLIGPCRRCHMICINHETAEKIKEPYSTLAKYRRFKGKIYFGQHMIHVAELSNSPFEIKSGAKIEVLEKFQDQQEIFK